MVSQRPTLEVVMATFNGAAYLQQQLISIEAQTWRPDRLLVRDDGSSDGTIELLKSWSETTAGWLQLLPPDGLRLGCCGSFAALLATTQAAYVAVADQDDVWESERLERGMVVLQAEELRRGCCGKQPAMLLHSDATLIDAQGMPLHFSLWDWHGVGKACPGLAALAVGPRVTGCTMLLNQACLKQALPIPEQVVQYDWWLALVARHANGLLELPEALLQHRRHAANTSGPVHWLRLRQKWQRWLAVRRQWLAFQCRFSVTARQRLAWWCSWALRAHADSSI
ncbi:MAG: glycosyltransferase [Prochlorococcaceae cyanobacterium ETNP2_MAG_10]|nr:glycosyltransferase [Prochlorococcaceae cyanobacterium ETNP2_MAG_10]